MAEPTPNNAPAASSAAMEPAHAPSDGQSHTPESQDRENNSKRKRGGNKSLQHGSRNKGRDMGRGQYLRQQLDRRGRNTAEQNKRRKTEEQDAPRSGKYENFLPAPFSKEEIAEEGRKPKRKVAVMIGYSGTGYKGMQITPEQKTIEGDLFSAFVAAGAISKANADDPKKTSLVRCARTDKGVHAAGNVVSLKLIVEDEDIVEKINSHLTPQIRIWGIERTIGSFSCYQACDSRWYEYLLPTHTLLPPHPSSYLGKQLHDLAVEANDLEGYQSRQDELKTFWQEVEEKHIKPILDDLDPETRKLVESALYDSENDTDAAGDEEKTPADEVDVSMKMTDDSGTEPNAEEPTTKEVDPALLALRAATKRLKAAYLKARKAYRVDEQRVKRLQEALGHYVGTHNFHNYTIRKSAKDPSAKRHIKSFVVNGSPIIKDGTEWISLKVHGQSFMMHQIRKMVGMAALVVRCGCPTERIPETFTEHVISIPKAPSLGLLLERPVFDSYNTNQAAKHEREPIDFGKYEKEMQEFKDREIYDRMWKTEEDEGVFANFFAHLDSYRETFFLYLSSGGLKAAGDARPARTSRGPKAFGDESDAEEVQGGEEG